MLYVSTAKLCEAQNNNAPVAAVSLCVEVGSFQDPEVGQGLAHFLGKPGILTCTV